MDIAAISSLRRDWALRSRRPRADKVFEALVAAEPDLAAVGARDLASLVRALSEPPLCCAVSHWQIASALLRQFELDRLVGLGLLSSLVPGLVRIGRSLDWGRGGPWDDVEAFACELLATAWSVLARMAGETVDYPERCALDRVRAALCDQRRTARRQQARLRCVSLSSPPPGRPKARPGRGEEGADWELEDPQPLSVLESLAMALGSIGPTALSPGDVRLIFAHRVLGYSLREIADHIGEDKPDRLQHRSQIAERLLCTM